MEQRKTERIKRAEEILRVASSTLDQAATTLPAVIAGVVEVVVASLRAGGKVLLCGNGGSAADAQHLAAELAGRLRRERHGLPALALTVNSSVLTAVSNDYGYASVFARQVEALGREGDVLVGISTSGSSDNVVEALRTARATGMVTIGLLGSGGGTMEEYCDHVIRAPSEDTQRIQEVHIAVGHVICEQIEHELFDR